jgi:hypothetical protein
VNRKPGVDDDAVRLSVEEIPMNRFAQFIRATVVAALVGTAVAIAAPAHDAQAFSYSDSSMYIRPTIGGGFNGTNWANQFRLGADLYFNFPGNDGRMQMGPQLHFGFAGGFVDINVGGSFKYNFLDAGGNLPIVPYVNAGLSLHGIAATGGGVAFGPRFGGGFDYWVTQRIGVGASLDFDLGYSSLGDVFYFTPQFMVGAQFKL